MHTHIGCGVIVVECGPIDPLSRCASVEANIPTCLAHEHWPRPESKCLSLKMFYALLPFFALLLFFSLSLSHSSLSPLPLLLLFVDFGAFIVSFYLVEFHGTFCLSLLNGMNDRAIRMTTRHICHRGHL